ncbi:MAG: hypothetical protein PVH00_14995 [Gemmatimonadota bacterium]|jgi:hypothetical protein
MSTERDPTVWGPARTRLAISAVLVATGTAALGAVLGGTGNHVVGAVGYIAVTVAALFRPGWITGQVVTGLMMAAGLMIGPAAASSLRMLPLVAGIIATAELLAAAARLDAPVERVARGELRRAGLAAGLGAVVFAAVLFAGVLPGPSGLLAVGLASAACVVLAILLVTRRSGRTG